LLPLKNFFKQKHLPDGKAFFYSSKKILI